MAALFSALKPTPYLTKLSKRLSPEEMRDDIRFARAAVAADYRQWNPGPMFIFWVGAAAIVGLAALLLQFAGRGRWRCNGFAWFAISMFLSPLALLLLFYGVGRQWWQSR